MQNKIPSQITMKKPLSPQFSPVPPSVQSSRFNSSTVQCFPFRRPLFAVGSSILLLLSAGCQVLTYSSPTGERFTRSSLGANTSIQSLSLDSATNGLRHLELNGYQNDSTQALGTVTEAAVKAAIQGAK
jgi:hypothetical protein